MHARGRRQVDNAAGALLLDKLPGSRLRAKKGAVEVDRDHRAPAIGREVHAGRRDTAAVIVDHDVEAAEMLDRRGDHLVAFGGVADVDHEHLASATELANFVTHRLKMGGVAAGDQHGGAAQREFARDRDPDSSSAAGDDRNFACNAENVFQGKASCSDTLIHPVAGCCENGKTVSLTSARKRWRTGGRADDPHCGYVARYIDAREIARYVGGGGYVSTRAAAAAAGSGRSRRRRTPGRS